MQLKITALTRYDGPNPYADEPVVVGSLHVDSEHGEALASAMEQMLRLYPHWGSTVVCGEEITPSVRAATMIAHWVLGALNEVRGDLHAAGACEDAGHIRLWVGFHEAQVTVNALKIVMHGLQQALDGETLTEAVVLPHLEALWTQCRAHHPDYQARILMQGARLADVPILPWVSGARMWQFGHGARSRVFFESASNQDGFLGARVAGNKTLAKALFQSLGAPTVAHVLVDKAEALEASVQRIGWPCVTKPVDAGKGRGVTANIQHHAALLAGFERARAQSRSAVMLEAFQPGHDHRLMVVEGELISVTRRHPPVVVGDGQHSVRALVSQINQSRGRNLLISNYYFPVSLDESVLEQLQHQGLDLDSIPDRDREVTLRSNANMSTGGYCTAVPVDELHSDVRRMAEAIAQASGLNVAGLDYLTPDIRKSWTAVGGAFIEINITPGIDTALFAGFTEQQLGQRILGDKPGRIPVQLLVVDQVDIPVLEQTLRAQTDDPERGWVCGENAGFGTVPIACSKTEPWHPVHAVLRQTQVTRLTIVTTSAAIERHGLPVDRLTETVLGAKVSAGWMPVLARLSKEIRELSGQNALIAALW